MPPCCCGWLLSSLHELDGTEKELCTVYCIYSVVWRLTQDVNTYLESVISSSSIQQTFSCEALSIQIFCLLCYPKVYYRVHGSLPLDPSMNQINAVYILAPSFFKIQFNIIFQSTHGFLKGIFSH